jgi:hypothetical protein
MVRSSKIEIDKFNGQSFESWKLNMEDLLVEKDQWIIVDLGNTPIGTLTKDWVNLDRKEKRIIWSCLLHSVLLNVSRKATTDELWNKLRVLSQFKSLVNKLFMRKKLYNLRMKDGDSMTKHLNTFNTVVSHLLFVDIKISGEYMCISLLFSLPNSCDSLVLAIGSNATNLSFDDVVSSLLLEETRQKNIEIQRKYALFVR